jgi:hypothetical protein
MAMSNLIPLLYHSGNHGNWLLWCLNYFGIKEYCNMPIPLDLNNASHNHIFRKENNNGVTIDDYFQWRSCIRSGTARNSNIVLMHPPLKSNDYKNFVDCVGEDSLHMISIVSSPEHTLTQLNNAFFRAAFGGIFWGHVCSMIVANSLLYKEIYNINIPRVPSKAASSQIKHLPAWILREILSGLDLVSLSKTAHPTKLDACPGNVFKISQIDFYQNFEDTICECIQWLGQPYTLQNQDKMSTIHTHWMSTQTHINKDQLVNNIIQNIDSTVNFNWDTLSILDESVIQHQLGKKGIRLKVYNLNMLPTNLTDLRKICE